MKKTTVGSTRVSEDETITLDDIAKHVMSRFRASPSRPRAAVTAAVDLAVGSSVTIKDRYSDGSFNIVGFTESGKEGNGVAKTSAFYNRVLANGELWNPYTNRRWLPRQYLRLMADYDNCVHRGYCSTIGSKGMLRFLADECEKLAFLEKTNRISFEERSKFLPVETAARIVVEYVDRAREELDTRRGCERRTETSDKWYSTVTGRKEHMWTHEHFTTFDAHGESSETDKWVKSDVNRELTETLDRCREAAKSAVSYGGLEDVFRKLPSLVLRTHDSDGHETNWLPRSFKDAYEKAGAYYTLKHLIVNGNIVLATEKWGWWTSTENLKCPFAIGTPAAVRWSLDELRKLVNLDGYVLHAILKHCMSEAGVTARSLVSGR